MIWFDLSIEFIDRCFGILALNVNHYLIAGGSCNYVIKRFCKLLYLHQCLSYFVQGLLKRLKPFDYFIWKSQICITCFVSRSDHMVSDSQWIYIIISIYIVVNFCIKENWLKLMGIMLTSSKSGLRELHFRGKIDRTMIESSSFSPDVIFSNLLVSVPGQEEEIISDWEDW